MTTIAWDGKRIAADGLSTCDGFVVATDDPKLFRRKGVVIGVAGDWASAVPMVEFIAGQRDFDSECKDITALAIRNGKGVVYEGRKTPYPVKPPYAIGSGACFALAAMEAGTDALKAVKVACKLDTASGGKCRSMAT